MYRIKLFNQMAGPLFRELSIELAKENKGGTVLFTGHPSTLGYEDNICGLDVKPMPLYNRKSIVARMFSWLKYTIIASYHILKMDSREEALFTSNPPLLIISASIARFLGRKYHFLIYDVYPDILINLGVIGRYNILVFVWKFLNKFALEGAQGVYTISEKMAESIELQFISSKTYKRKVNVVPLWVDTQKFRPLCKQENEFAKSYKLENKFIVLYSGNMGISHDFAGLLEAAKLLKGEPNVAFVFIGDGAKRDEIVRYVSENQLNNTLTLPFQSEHMLPQSLSMADLSVVSLESSLDTNILPSKVVYSMAVGSALLGICAEKSELSKLIKRANCGIVADRKSAKEIANDILNLSRDSDLLKSYKNRSVEYCREFHEKQVCLTNFLNEIKK